MKSIALAAVSARTLSLASSLACAIALVAPVLAVADDHRERDASAGYEVWASDQSNSVPGAEAPGFDGSFIWIWKQRDIERQIRGGADARPVPCLPSLPLTRGEFNRILRRAAELGNFDIFKGPCDLKDVFPADLREFGADGKPTGRRLGDLSRFGRLHGMLADPQQRYVTANIFAPEGGYVGIIDTQEKAAVALFRVTETNATGVKRSVHMSFWDADGDAVIVANLHGKVLERIDVERDAKGRILKATFNRSASLGVGKGMEVTDGATYFRGRNAHGRRLRSRMEGDYADADFGDLTPNGACKENGCASGPDGDAGGRVNNVIICPIPSDNGNAYVTMGGGGLLVAKTGETPMRIVGEYGNQAINGAGCGGGQAGDAMWLNAGVSASGAGATQSTFSVYALDDTAFPLSGNAQNTPVPLTVFKDETNTNTIGNLDGVDAPNMTGQLPGETTRRDAHGVAVTVDEGYLHNVDRVQNVVEVFDTQTLARTTYDLTSADGQGNGEGPCGRYSVTDDPFLPLNDPAPDLLERTPDGKYLAIAFRGPNPVSVGHSAQGSCPGVGIVELLDGGAGGRLATVLRTTNTVDTTDAASPGGYDYQGVEHSDVHGAIVVGK